MSEVSEAEVDAALQELLHERNRTGDGCFGCGSGVHWGETQIHSRIPFYRDMLKRILEAAKGTHTPEKPSVQPRPAVTIAPPRSRLDDA